MTSFKYYIAEKLKKAFYLGVFVLLILILNYALWLPGETFVLFVLAIFILIKLVAIPLYFFQKRSEFEKPAWLFIALALFLFMALLFDFVVIPDLSIDNFGTSTEGTAIDFQITQTLHGKRYIITYEFKVNETTRTTSQSVDRTLYEQLKLSPSTQIKYLSGYPNISYLRDVNYLKLSTFLDLFIGVGMTFVLYLDKIEDELNEISKVV